MTEIFENYDFSKSPCTTDWNVGTANTTGSTSTVKFEVRVSAPGVSTYTAINWSKPNASGTQSFNVPSAYQIDNVTVCFFVSVYKGDTDPWAVYIEADLSSVSGTASYTAPTINSVSVDKTSGVTPLTVQFGSSVAAGCPTGVTYNWTIQKYNGTTWDTYESGITDPSFSRTFSSPGTYRGSLVASNEKVSSSATTTDSIVVSGIAPTSAFSADKVLAPTDSTIQFIDQSTNTPTSWEWKYQKDGVGGYTNFTNYTSQNPKQTFTVEGKYDISLKVTNAWGNDTETKLEYILVDDDVLVGAYPYKGSNEYGILLMNGTSYEHLIYHKGKTAAILGMKVTRSEGDTSVAEFTLTATQRMDNEDILLQTGTHVYVLHYDWVSFSGIISKVENNTTDVYGSTTDPLRKIKVTCEGATSLLKREFIGNETVITNTPGEIYKAILTNSGCSNLEGTVQTDSAGTQKRQFGIVKGTTYDAVSNLCDSTGYRIYDEPEGQYFRGVFTDYSTGTIQFASSDTVSDIAVNDYLIYLKRDATAIDYDATDPNNTLARFKVAGRVNYVSGDTIRITTDTTMASFGTDETYVKYGVALVIKNDGLRVGFTLDDDTNIEPLLDIGKMVLDSNLVDTDYINATVYNCTTVNQGKKVSVTLPACVKVDANGVGNYFTFVSPYPCGTTLVSQNFTQPILKGHSLWDTTDKPDYITFRWVGSDGLYSYITFEMPTNTTEVFYDGIPVTMLGAIPGLSSYEIPSGSLILFHWAGDEGTGTQRFYTRMYVSDTTGFYDDTFITVGVSDWDGDMRYKSMSTQTGYIVVFLPDMDNIMYLPKNTGCIVYKKRSLGNNPYSIDSAEPDSPIEQRGVITQTITCAQGSTIPELEAIASSYVVSKGVFADIGEGRVPSRYAYSSTYPIPLEVDYTINKPIVDGTMVKVRFNDETRDYRVAKATYDYMRYMATFEFGGKKRDIPDTVKSVMSVTNITG